MNSMQSNSIIEARAVSRDFKSGSSVVHAVRSATFSLQSGEMAALRGRSGSGKTTLLNILAGLDTPTSGEVIALGFRLNALSEFERTKLRRMSFGVMFQNAHLFPTLTAQENVEIPLRLAGAPRKEREAKARAALEMVGLLERARHRSMELSGGEQQRTALARALAHTPKFLMADEPTGNLDSLTGKMIASLLRDISRKENICVLIATHDQNVVDIADTTLLIHDGIVTAEQAVRS